MPDNSIIKQYSRTTGLDIEIIYAFEYINYWTVGNKQYLGFTQRLYRNKEGDLMQWHMVPAIMDIMDILDGEPARRCGFNGHGYDRILTIGRALHSSEKRK